MSDTTRGTLLAITAHLLWGVAPLYWVQTAPVDSNDLLVHRIVWSAPTLLLTLWFMRELGSTMQWLRQPRTMAILAACAALSAGNWGIFLWAVSNGQTSNASMGYFLLPLVNVALGLVVFRERIEPLKLVAVAFAVLGVGVLIVAQGGLPWVALGVAFTFGTYSAVRKGVTVGALPGLGLESLLMLPFALYVFLLRDGAGLGQHGLRVDVFLLGAGLMTVVPLLASIAGSRLMPLTAMGLVGYIGPSTQLLIAVAIFNEPLPPERLLAFGLVWTGLVVLTLGSLRRMSRRDRPVTLDARSLPEEDSR